jgi:hypothetical protein
VWRGGLGGAYQLPTLSSATACRVARLPGGSDRGFPQPTETFTSELSNGSVALPAVGLCIAARYRVSGTNKPSGPLPIVSNDLGGIQRDANVDEQQDGRQTRHQADQEK